MPLPEMIDIGADLPAQVRLLAAGNFVATRAAPLHCTLTQDAIYFPRDRDMPRAIEPGNASSRNRIVFFFIHRHLK